MIRVMIVDSNTTRRKQRAEALHFQRDIQVVGIGSDILEAWETNLYSSDVDVILITLDRIDEIIISDWAMLRILLPNPGVIALVDENLDNTIELALAIGVMGLHDLDVEPGLLSRAVRNVDRGLTDYDSLLLTRILDIMLKKNTYRYIESQ